MDDSSKKNDLEQEVVDEVSLESGEAAQDTDEGNGEGDASTIDSSELETSSSADSTTPVAKNSSSQDQQQARTSGKKLVSGKLILVLIVMVLIGAALIVAYLPDFRGEIAQRVKDTIMSKREFPQGQLYPEDKQTLIQDLTIHSENKTIIKDVNRLSFFPRVLYNITHYISGPQSVRKSEASSLTIRYEMKNTNSTIRLKGRSLKEAKVTYAWTDGQKIDVIDVKYEKFFDQADAEKLAKIFQQVASESQSDFEARYNRLLDITTLGMKYYDSEIRRSEKLNDELKEAYNTYKSYMKFKENGKSKFVKANPTELIRCFLYDHDPRKTQDGRFQMAPLLEKLRSIGVKNLSSDNIYQVLLLLKKRSGRLDPETRKGLALILLQHPSQKARKHFNEYLLKEDPGVIVAFLDSINLDFFSVFNDDQERKDAQSAFMASLIHAIKDAEHVSVQRQALVTAYRFRKVDPDSFKKALKIARQNDNEQIKSTISYLQNES